MRLGRFSIYVLFALVVSQIGLAQQVQLQWDPNPETNLSNYNIYRSERSGSGYQKISQVPGSTTSFVDRTISYDKKYYYVCTAVDGAGLESGYSNEVYYLEAAPVSTIEAVDDSATTLEDQPVLISVLENDPAYAISSVAIVSVSQASAGSVEIKGETILYIPGLNFFGTDSFSYTIQDTAGGQGTAYVQVTVSPVNDSPLLGDDAFSVNMNNSVTLQVLQNDGDPDGDALSVTFVTQPASGSTALNPDSTITYAPKTDFEGLDSFLYTVSDGKGGSATASVSITVTNPNPQVNRAPIPADDYAETLEETTIRIYPLNNDLDPDGDPLEISSASKPPNGKMSVVKGRYIVYAPYNGFVGDDSFEYVVTDDSGESATAVINVTVQADPNLVNQLNFPKGLGKFKKFDDTYVGVALMNPKQEEDTVSVSSTDSSNSRSVELHYETTLGSGEQTAFLVDELTDNELESGYISAEGTNGAIQGVFTVGSYDAKKLDGVNAELRYSETLYLPIVHQSDQWETLFQLINNSPEVTKDALLELYDSDGRLQEEKVAIIKPGGSVTNSIKEFFDLEDSLNEGFVKISASGPIGGYELIGGPKTIASIPALRAESVGRLYSPHFFVDERGGTTRLRLLNTDFWQARVKISLNNDNGDLIGYEEVALGYHRMAVIDLRELLFSEVEGLISGSVKLEIQNKVSSRGKVLATVTMTTAGQEAESTITLNKSGMRRTMFPHVAQLSDGSIFTGFALLNPSDSNTQVQLEVYSESGKLTARKTLWMKAHSRIAGTLNSDTFFGPSFEQIKGYVKLRSDFPVVSMALFGDIRGRFLSTIENLPAMELF